MEGRRETKADIKMRDLLESETSAMSFWVYMLRCADESFYVGHTDDVEARLAQHHSGADPGCHTFKRRPLELVFAQECTTRIEALESEQRIKRWSRAKKEALIASDWGALKSLAKRRTPRAEAGGSIASVSSDREAVASTSAPHHERVKKERSATFTPHCERAGMDLSTKSAPRLEQARKSESLQFPVRGEEASRRLAGANERPSRTTCQTSDETWMRHALALADRAEREDDEVPVGAVLVAADGSLLAEGWNRNIVDHDPTAHAEIVAIRQAGMRLGNHRLVGCTLYVTLEPCAMCAMAMVHARMVRVVYAASDPKTGACGSVFDLLADPRHNHRIEVVGGVMADEASRRLSNYFRRKRGKPPL